MILNYSLKAGRLMTLGRDYFSPSPKTRKYQCSILCNQAKGVPSYSQNHPPLVVFRPLTVWIDPPMLERKTTLLCLLILMFMPSQSTLEDTIRKISDQISGHPMPLSSWHIKFNTTHYWTKIFCIKKIKISNKFKNAEKYFSTF
jgi:hypothetical protein